jgi:hypothetical protein
MPVRKRFVKTSPKVLREHQSVFKLLEETSGFFTSLGVVGFQILWGHLKWSVHAGPLRQSPRSSKVAVRAVADDLTTPQTGALVSGAIFNPIVLYSEFTLFTTGKGLDPGPGGLYGALEGIGQPLNFPCESRPPIS